MYIYLVEIIVLRGGGYLMKMHHILCGIHSERIIHKKITWTLISIDIAYRYYSMVPAVHFRLIHVYTYFVILYMTMVYIRILYPIHDPVLWPYVRVSWYKSCFIPPPPPPNTLTTLHGHIYIQPCMYVHPTVYLCHTRIHVRGSIDYIPCIDRLYQHAYSTWLRRKYLTT